MLSASALPVWAQVDTGGITGVITDETGAALPGVTVTVTSLATRQERTAVTNERGRYQVTALPPSKYSVQAELTGFTTVVRPEVTVNVGSVVDINMTLKVAALQETVTVTGEAPLVESTRTDLSNVVSQEYLESLPSKSREYLDFTLLMPATTETVAMTQGTGAVIGGARSKEGMLLVDGFFNGDEGFSSVRLKYSQDAIQEFQVVSFGGSAEHGRAIGGIINAVTKSGGNAFHGSTYGFFRDTNLNANDFGARRRGAPKSPFDRQQWGGSLGGPIKSDKSFFFVAAERVAEDSPFDNGIKQADAAIIGLPTGDVGAVPRFYRNTFGMVKWDHNLSSNDRFLASFSAGRWSDSRNWVRPLESRSRAWVLHPDDYSMLGKWTKVAAEGRMLHEAKVSYSPRFYWLFGQNLGGPPLVPDGEMNKTNPLTPTSPPSVNISSVASFGSVSLNNIHKTYPVQAIYTSSIFTEKHTFKFGADYMYAHQEYFLYSPFKGSYSFPSLAAYQRGAYSQYSQSFGDPSLPRTHHYYSTFVQDSWQASNRLTMNYGLRYDLELNVKQEQSGIRYGPNDYNNVGPRFAVSYDLTNQGTTLLKLTTGMYYDRVWNNATIDLYDLKDHQLRVSATWTPTTPGAPVYPQVFAEKPANLRGGVVDVVIMPDKTNIPTSGQVVGTIEHALTPNLALSASAVYTRSWDKEFRWDTNLVWDESGQRYVRLDPSYRQIRQVRYEAPAKYVGGIFEVTARGKKLGFNGNLTVAQAYETAGVFSFLNDQRDGIAGDWGAQPDTPAVRGVLSGWYNLNQYVQLSGTFRARSGLPVNPVAAGRDLNGDGRLGDRTPTLKSFSFRSPGNNWVDVRFTWMVPFHNGRKLHFYVESFNLFNHENVRTVLNDYGLDPTRPGPRWMEPSSFYPPREVQLGVRLTF